MNNFLNQLNLTPQERRIVAIIFLVVIIVLNFLFVWPHFGEWGKINKQLADMRKQIEDHNRTILIDTNPTNGWRKQVDNLASKERKEGSAVSAAVVDPQVQLQNTIRLQERKTGVIIQDFRPGAVKTNDAFFEEHSTQITLEAQEPQLVSFLYNMGNDLAMIRVAKLDLKPLDQNRYKLKGSITLTANYQKKAPTAGPAPSTAAAPAKPALGIKPGGSQATNRPAPAATIRPNPAAPALPVKHPPPGPLAPGAKPQVPGGPPQPNRPRRMPVQNPANQ